MRCGAANEDQSFLILWRAKPSGELRKAYQPSKFFMFFDLREFKMKAAVFMFQALETQEIMREWIHIIAARFINSRLVIKLLKEANLVVTNSGANACPRSRKVILARPRFSFGSLSDCSSASGHTHNA